jgi:hypothetical protein
MAEIMFGPIKSGFPAAGTELPYFEARSKLISLISKEPGSTKIFSDAKSPWTIPIL